MQRDASRAPLLVASRAISQGTERAGLSQDASSAGTKPISRTPTRPIRRRRLPLLKTVASRPHERALGRRHGCVNCDIEAASVMERFPAASPRAPVFKPVLHGEPADHMSRRVLFCDLLYNAGAIDLPAIVADANAYA